MSRILARLLPLVLLCQSPIGSAGAQQILNVGDAVVTGFSGTVAPDPNRQRPPNKSVVDLTFINPDGASARVVDLRQPGYVWDGRLWAARKPFDVFARDVGQVFGVALDDDASPNIYLAATSAFGLNIVGRGADGQPERLKRGRDNATWMNGQFGLRLAGGPGSIYRVDGRTGEVKLLINVTLNNAPNPGPGLGNLAYDAAHKQLFVSDLHTGMIHRIGLDGRDLGRYDHGVSGRAAVRLPAVQYNPQTRADIWSANFNAENPDSWGFAPPARRVWGLAVHQDRLYYSVVDGPRIWSVGIQQDGSFANDARWELDVTPQPGPYPVSDIAFSEKGAMILAQRAVIAASYDYSAFIRPGEPRVLRYWLEQPDDPRTPSRWRAVPEEYAVGFAGNYRNSDGGVDLGYGVRQDGTLNTNACEYAIWTTGDNLRNNPALRNRLLPGGEMLVHGLQGSPASPVRRFNEPPWVSYFVDYDDTFADPRARGHIGGVRILKQPCTGAVAIYGGPGHGGTPPYISGGNGDGGCVGPDCPPKACFTSTGTFECTASGWVYKLTVAGPGWVNTVTAVSLTSGVSVTSGQIPLNPANIAVSGAPGSSAIIEICAFNATAAASGNPYDCCRDKVRVTIPNRACGPVRR